MTSTPHAALSSRTPDYLRGRHAVVTGGGRGIGAAIATELARLGANLTLLGRSAGTLDAHAAALRDELDVRVETMPCDVADADAVDRAFAAARAALGDPYILVNNAGQAESALLADTTRALWDRMLAVNLTAVFTCTQRVLPAMLAAKAGRVINIASTAGVKGYARTTAYGAAKHGVIGLTRALAMETANHGITVNAVCPGYTDTDMSEAAVRNVMSGRGTGEAEARAMIARTIPRGTLIRPDEVANTVGWLCSPAAGAITGQSILVAGGEVM